MAESQDTNSSQRIRNHLIQGLATILRQLDVETLDNDRLDSLQFRLDWIYRP